MKYLLGRKRWVVSSGAPEDCANFFADNIYESKTFRNDLLLGLEAYVGWNVSSSYAPREDKDPEAYQGFVSELGELFGKRSANGILNYPHLSICYVGNL